MVGSRPRFTPMLMKVCTPIQMAMPFAVSPAKVWSMAIAWRPMSNARLIIQ
ncbi:hypothetical protein D3C72_2587550 [compost metagenome]